MSNGEPLDPRCSGTHEAWMFYLQKNLWRVWKLRIITKTTPKPLDLTSNGVKTRITIVSKLRWGCDILCHCHFCSQTCKIRVTHAVTCLTAQSVCSKNHPTLKYQNNTRGSHLSLIKFGPKTNKSERRDSKWQPGLQSVSRLPETTTVVGIVP